MKKIPKTIIVEHCGNDHLEPIRPVCTEPVHGFPKPKNGGLWTSPVGSENGWREWCISENFNVGSLEKNFRLEVSTEKLLIIDCYEDFVDAMISTNIMKLGQYEPPYIEWSELLKKYDGIWLTVKGESETRYAHPYNLYGWDCETVFLFNEKPIVRKL